MENFKNVVKKYNVFSGRSTRREFWMFVIVSFLISAILSILDSVLGFKGLGNDNAGVLSSIFSILMILPSVAVGTRRLHDTNRSGWWQLLGIIPILGWIVLIVFFAQDSNPGENKYGPNPKAAATPAPAPTPAPTVSPTV